jgi:hypothetical protein
MVVGEVAVNPRRVSKPIQFLAWAALGLSVIGALFLVYFKIQEAGKLRDEALAYLGWSQLGTIEGQSLDPWVVSGWLLHAAWLAVAAFWVFGSIRTSGFTVAGARWPILAAGVVSLAALILRIWRASSFDFSLLPFGIRYVLWPPYIENFIRPDMYNNELWLYVGVLLPLAGLVSAVAAICWFVSTRTPSSESASLGEVNVMPGQGASGRVPSGWYPDPDGKPADRYWDGDAWTEQTRPATAPRPAATVTRALAGPGYNVLAIIAFVSAFVVPLVLPIVLGYIALGQIKRTSEGGRGLALAAVILGWIFTVFFVLYVAVVVLAVSSST